MRHARSRRLAPAAVLGLAALAAAGGCTRFETVVPGDGFWWLRGGGEAAAVRHVVAPGDSLWTIAERYDVAMDDVVRVNHLSSPDRLYVGDVLTIPEAGGRGFVAVDPAPEPVSRVVYEPSARTASVPVPDAPPTAAVGPARLATPPAAGAAPRTHVVRSGEMLSSVAQRYRVRTGELMVANGMSGADHIEVGQVLVIPGAIDTTPRFARMDDAGRGARGRADLPPPPLGGDGFLWPAEGRVIAAFGETLDGRPNPGVNIALRAGTPVRAAENGVVAYAADGLPAYGNLLILRHADGFSTAYAHNASLVVRLGDRVTRGQIVARSGRTGNVAEPQLHFGLRQGAGPVDPLKHLNAGPSAVVAGRD